LPPAQVPAFTPEKGLRIAASDTDAQAAAVAATGGSGGTTDEDSELQALVAALPDPAAVRAQLPSGGRLTSVRLLRGWGVEGEGEGEGGPGSTSVWARLPAGAQACGRALGRWKEGRNRRGAGEMARVGV
jgi:hypothetical protein